MASIAQNVSSTTTLTNNLRYLPHEIKTRLGAVQLLQSGTASVEFVVRRYHVSRASLYRWLKRYDGSKQSLVSRSHKPLTPHPNAHTGEELKWIKNYMKRFPELTIAELWRKLKEKRNYQRSIGSLYRAMRRLGYMRPVISSTSGYKPRTYQTPTHIGEKWQIDVKHVPTWCLSPWLQYCGKRLYQYTCLDEASRERFIYFYDEQTPNATVDFVSRAGLYYGYLPKEIQTDNGMEFTYPHEKFYKPHPLDLLCSELGIYHHTIRPRTPRHNGKVERSHKSDNERFYAYNVFFSLHDLQRKGAKYLTRSNNIPMQVLDYKTPLEKRQEIIKRDNLLV